MRRYKDRESFIKISNELHDNFYDYRNFIYKGKLVAGEIICPVHGPFMQTPNVHAKPSRPSGCPLCGNERRRISFDEFVERARKIHGDAYEYDKSTFTKMGEKTRIFCKKHNHYFEQTPNNHVHPTKPTKCPLCALENVHKTTRKSFEKCSKKTHNVATKHTLEEVISRANEIHDSKYDYSLITEYKNNKIKYPIICHEKDKHGNEHGVFYMNFVGHNLKKRGCPKCTFEKCQRFYGITVDEFLESANAKHNSKFQYPNIENELKNGESIITIKCPIHGEFKQRVRDHLNGAGCKICNKHTPYTTDSIIQKFKEAHPYDNYDYSKVIYKGYEEKVEIICTVHGSFLQTPDKHISGNGCPLCGKEKNIKSRTNDGEEVIKRCKKIHNGFYDYSKSKYVGLKTKFIVTCPKHGDFLITPGNHLRGNGCPKCKRSKLETRIEGLLTDNNIKFISQCNRNTFGWLGYQSFDFYLPDYNIAIECQGEQHFKPFEHWGGEKAFEEICERDERKYKLCCENGVGLLYYTQYKTNDFYKDKRVFTSKKALLNAIYNK